ncbi:hypothetical protein LTR81_010591 [Elasticomyces elasticus]
MYRLLPIISLLLATATAWGPPSSSHLPQCSPRVISIATGIYLNIQGQHAELNQTISLQSLESSSFSQSTFDIQKGELIADIKGGMSIREFNQAVAPTGNAALPGLATYAAAQSTELGLAESLTGMPSHDLPILVTIHSDVVAGTQLNEYNLGNATAGCNLGFDLTSY